jgi:RHS repeat-associated protein
MARRLLKKLEKDVWTQSGGSTTTTRMAYNGASIWADLSSGNALLARYLRGDQIDNLIARIVTSGSTPTASWYLPDRLGSIRNITDANGNPVDTITYDGFGNVTNETNTTAGDRWKFTGRELDNETGLQFNRARYYNGPDGRWTSQDPLGFGAGDENLYRYVDNSPTNAGDPSGRDGPFGGLLNWIWGGPYIPTLPERHTFTVELDNFVPLGTLKIKYINFYDAYAKETNKVLEDLWPKIRTAYDDIEALGHAFNEDGSFNDTKLASDAKLARTYRQVCRWFIAPGDKLTRETHSKIEEVFHAVYSAPYNYTLRLKDEPDYKGNSAAETYNLPWDIPWPSYFNVHLYPKYWKLTESLKEAVLFHEFTHLYAGTADYGYYSWSTGGYVLNGSEVKLTTDQLIHNADTYSSYLYLYYLQ